MARRATFHELIWPQTPEFIAAASVLAEDVVVRMLAALWHGYDALLAQLADIHFDGAGDEGERSLTMLLHGHTEDALDGYEPYVCRYAYREFETRLPAPAQAPEYDIAFVLTGNPRIAWPVEAKLLRTAGAIADYVADVQEQFLTCRYGPFSSGGAMVAYLMSGETETLFQNLADRLATELLPMEAFVDRAHRCSSHLRIVPPERDCPADFECHHLAMPIFGANGRR